MAKARIFNDSDIPVSIRIARFELNEPAFAQNLGSNQTSAIIDLAEGDRVFMAWDLVNQTIVGPVRVEPISDFGVRFRFIGANGNYKWSVGAVPDNENP